MSLRLPHRRPLPGGASPGAPSPPAGGEPGAGSRTGGKPPGRLRLLALVVATIVVAVAAGLATFLLARPQPTPPGLAMRPSGIPASISTRLANLMELTPLPHVPAPGFTLTDQHGHTLSLASLRGKAVVLEFMDPHCTDICPIVSQEFVDAYRELGPAAAKVVFVAVNVNQFHASVADVAAFSQAHQLTAIPDWHFFTGPVPELRAVWRDYHIEVAAPHPGGDILHTSAVYFIDPQGRERYLASPMVGHTKSGTAFLPVRDITSWGHGIAVLARGLAG